MRDDVVLDAVVNVAGKHAVIEQVLLGAVRPEAHNSACPTGRHSGNFEKFVNAGVIDVDAHLRRRNWFGLRRGLRIVRLRNRETGLRDRCKAEDQKRSEGHHKWIAKMHAIIFCLPTKVCNRSHSIWEPDQSAPSAIERSRCSSTLGHASS